MRHALIIFLFFSSRAVANQSMSVGDGQIDGTDLQPYELTWRQCNASDGSWHAGPDLTEKLVVIGSDVVRVQHFLAQPDGTKVVATFYFDRQSLAPIRLEQRATAGDGTELGQSEHILGDNGYTGRRSRGNQSKDVSGDVSSQMLHGGAMGIPLALLPYQKEPLEFRASMISMDSSYKVTASWVGKEEITFEDVQVEAWLIDVEWLHEGIGDIYPGGPDSSGGRYWVAHNPPDGFPYVPRYQTDTYAVEFVAGVCPEAGEEVPSE